MSANYIKQALVCGCLCALCSVGFALEPPPLAYNPFSRPPSENIRAIRTPEASDSNPPTSMDLRATLVAHRKRLANVGGKILKPGDEIEGFTLLAVFEDRAEFDYRGSRIVMYVRTPQGGKDD